jgi:hypothetical protein
MAIAVNYAKTVRYVVSRERALPKEKQTVYILKPRSIAGGRAVAQAFKESGFDAIIAQLRYTLAGWENLLEANGHPAEFKKDQAGLATEETLSRIPEKDREELAFSPEIERALSEADVGN